MSEYTLYLVTALMVSVTLVTSNLAFTPPDPDKLQVETENTIVQSALSVEMENHCAEPLLHC
jgi:hypothetical protein